MYNYMYTGCIYYIQKYTGIPAYITPTVQILHYCDQDRCEEKLANLENEIYRVQYGAFLTKFGHKSLLSLSAQPDNL